jgi:uncharacterized membrane protein
MKVRLRHLWELVSTNYWFVPSVMTIAAAVAAFVMLHIDRIYFPSDIQGFWFYSGGADGAKTLLSTVAGSIITVAGVVFSITIAALTQASSQFGPRLLRNFMRDASNQVVLGTFVATFVYCLLVLRTIHGKVGDYQSFVPQASVTGAVLLSVASVAVLIYFIHHVSMSLQAPNIVASVRADLLKVLNRMAQSTPDATAAPEEGPASLPAEFSTPGCPILSTCDGYIQAVDYEELLAVASESNLLLRVACRAGDYIISGNPLLHAWPADGCAPELGKRMIAAFICGNQRTSEQDLEYAIRQMVEVAVRALSPGINDPFTAINCIDALGSVVCRAARAKLPSPRLYDQANTLRLVTPVSTFAGITDAAFNQIRQYGRDSVAVTICLLETIEACAIQIRAEGARQALLRQAQMIYRQSKDAILEREDRSDVQCRWEAVAKALRGAAWECAILEDPCDP